MNKLQRAFYSAIFTYSLAGAGCAPALDETARDETPAELADIHVDTNSCNHFMDLKLIEAYGLVRELDNVFDWPGSNFINCLAAAPLVETLGVASAQQDLSADDCRGHEYDTAGSIWRALMSYSVSSFSCEDLNPTPSMDGSIVVGRAGPNSNQVQVQVDRTWLLTATARQVAAVLLHEMSHNLGFMHSAHEFGETLSPLTVPYQVQACMANGVPNPAPAGFPDMAAVCAADPQAQWEMASVNPSSAAAQSSGSSWAFIQVGPFPDDSWFVPQGPASTWPHPQ